MIAEQKRASQLEVCSQSKRFILARRDANRLLLSRGWKTVVVWYHVVLCCSGRRKLLVKLSYSITAPMRGQYLARGYARSPKPARPRPRHI
jgi:hypothetical protein